MQTHKHSGGVAASPYGLAEALISTFKISHRHPEEDHENPLPTVSYNFLPSDSPFFQTIFIPLGPQCSHVSHLPFSLPATVSNTPDT